MGILSKCFALLVILTLTAAVGNAPGITNEANTSTPSDSQIWSKTYGQGGASSVIQTIDGGYVLAGGRQEAGSYDFLLIKTDSSGKQLWSKTYSGPSDHYDYASCVVVQTVDGGYALAGQISFGNWWHSAWLIKTDASGNQQWIKNYNVPGGLDGDIFSSLVQSRDGGYAIAGSTTDSVAGDHSFWLVKTDASGNMLWNKTYGGPSDNNNSTRSCSASSLVETIDGGYTLAGSTWSMAGGSGNWKAWLVKTDSSGNPQWNKTYGDKYANHAYSIVKTSDDGYALAGSSTLNSGAVDFWLVKIDASGNQLWNKTYDSTVDDYAYSLVQTSDSGYALAGRTGAYGEVDGNFWLVKTDSSGNQLWNKTFGGSGDDVAYSIIQTSDGGYALAGETDSFTVLSIDSEPLLVKTDPSGNSALPPLKFSLTFYLLLAAMILVISIIGIVLFQKKRRSPPPADSFKHLHLS